MASGNKQTKMLLCTNATYVRGLLLQIMGEISISVLSCRKKFSQEDLTTWLQNSQQEQVQANVNNTAGSQITSSSIESKLWGDHTKDDIHHKIDVIYEKIAFWRRNLFKLPSGVAGKKFISETTNWIEFWNQDVNEYKDIALKVLMVMPALLLQKPSFKSTAKQHSQCLSRRLTQWEKGEFDDLLREVNTIQAKLPTNHKGLNEERLAKTFAKLVLEEIIKVAAAYSHYQKAP